MHRFKDFGKWMFTVVWAGHWKDWQMQETLSTVIFANELWFQYIRKQKIFRPTSYQHYILWHWGRKCRPIAKPAHKINLPDHEKNEIFTVHALLRELHVFWAVMKQSLNSAAKMHWHKPAEQAMHNHGFNCIVWPLMNKAVIQLLITEDIPWSVFRKPEA